MEEREIIKNNEMIANFMGLEGQHEDWCGNNVVCGDQYSDNGMRLYKPNEWWNDLMPVVEKIAEFEIKDADVIHNGQDSYFDSYYPRTFGMTDCDTREFMVRINRFPLHKSKSLIEATYMAVIEFIKWHNTNQSN